MIPNLISFLKLGVCVSVIVFSLLLCLICLGKLLLIFHVVFGSSFLDNSSRLTYSCLRSRIDAPAQSQLKPHLLVDPEDDQGIDFDFLSETVKRFEEDESLKPAFIAAVEEMSRDLSNKTINDDYKPYLTVCDKLLVSLGHHSSLLVISGVTKSRSSCRYRLCHHRIFILQCVH
jgi:hypothetical protein